MGHSSGFSLSRSSRPVLAPWRRNNSAMEAELLPPSCWDLRMISATRPTCTAAACLRARWSLAASGRATSRRHERGPVGPYGGAEPEGR